MNGPLQQSIFPFAGTDLSNADVVGAPASEFVYVNKLVAGVRFSQQRIVATPFSKCVSNQAMFTRINNATKERQTFFNQCYGDYYEKDRDTKDYGPGDTVEG